MEQPITPGEQRRAIRDLKLVWIYVETYPDRVYRRAGDNRGVHPSRVKSTTTGPHTALRKTINEDPIHKRKVHKAWAVAGEELVEMIAHKAKLFVSEHDVPLRGQWHDMEPKRMAELVEWAATVSNVELLDEESYWEIVNEYAFARRRRAKIVA